MQSHRFLRLQLILNEQNKKLLVAFVFIQNLIKQLNETNRKITLAGRNKATAYLSCRGMGVVLRIKMNKRTCFCIESIIQGFRSTNGSNLPETVPTMCPWFVGESLNWHHDRKKHENVLNAPLIKTKFRPCDAQKQGHEDK